MFIAGEIGLKQVQRGLAKWRSLHKRLPVAVKLDVALPQFLDELEQVRKSPSGERAETTKEAWLRRPHLVPRSAQPVASRWALAAISGAPPSAALTLSNAARAV